MIRQRNESVADSIRTGGVPIGFPLGQGVSLLFPTPFFGEVMADAHRINPELERTILAEAATRPGVGVSNLGGWHGPSDLFARNLAEVTVLEGWIGSALGRLKQLDGQPSTRPQEAELIGWANVNRRGDMNRTHVHPGWVWSGVYYVTAGDAVPDKPESGVLEFQDPRMGADMVLTEGQPYGGRTAIRPRDGLLILFPSWLPHTVLPYWGERPRISIAFNIRFRAGG